MSTDKTYAEPNEIRVAREMYAWGSDYTIEIDLNALASRGEDGVWVQAWVWVPNERLERKED